MELVRPSELPLEPVERFRMVMVVETVRDIRPEKMFYWHWIALPVNFIKMVNTICRV